jgi:flagellar motor switch/type III secretory pathway protein FliN
MDAIDTHAAVAEPPAEALPPPSAAVTSGPDFSGLLDLVCPVQILIGSGVITVRQCLGLRRHSILRLDPSVGDDLRLVARGVTVARGEVLIVEDSTVVRITDIGVDPVDRDR